MSHDRDKMYVPESSEDENEGFIPENQNPVTDIKNVGEKGGESTFGDDFRVDEELEGEINPDVKPDDIVGEGNTREGTENV